MKRSLCAVVLLAAPLFAADSRTVDAVFTATLQDLPRDARELEIWIPVPVSTAMQSVSDLEIDSPYDWTRGRDAGFGNHYIHTRIESPNSGELTVRVRFRVTRSAQLFARDGPENPSPREFERNLRADRLVTISPRVRGIADVVTRGHLTPLAQARAIYDYVLSSVVYDKTVPGWGNGDTERACEIGAGNCTDFHSLFISLARAKGIPARFIIGFPMPEESGGRAGGYHCWVEFWVEDLGWVAADPSEASKSRNVVLRNFLFGNLDFNRVQFTVGRDIELGGATGEPLNYFIYPYAEADGVPAGVGTISLEYRDVTPSDVARVPAIDARTILPPLIGEP